MTALLAPWNGPVFGFLLRKLRNRSDAEDAAQEVFIRVVEALPKYEPREKFRAWIFQIARNQAALTANRRERIGNREVAVEPGFVETLAADVADAPDYHQLRSAVAQLPEAEREVVSLRLEEDLKFREIAERTGAPLNTVLGRMRNASRRLRESLTQSPNK